MTDVRRWWNARACEKAGLISNTTDRGDPLGGARLVNSRSYQGTEEPEPLDRKYATPISARIFLAPVTVGRVCRELVNSFDSA